MKETIGIKMHEDCIECPHRLNPEGQGTDWCHRLMNFVQKVKYCKLWNIRFNEMKLTPTQQIEEE